MKKNKTTLRSIRISDDMAELIEQQAGNNFTEKWTNLVTRCIWEQEEAKAQLDMYKRFIDQERERLHILEKKRQRLEQTMQRIQNWLDQELLSLKDV